MAPIPEFGNAYAFIESKRGITDREYLNRVLDDLKQLLADPLRDGSALPRMDGNWRKVFLLMPFQHNLLTLFTH